MGGGGSLSHAEGGGDTIGVMVVLTWVERLKL